MSRPYSFGGLAHLCISTRDMEESLRFYRDLLGFTVEYRTTLGDDMPSDGFWPLDYVLVRQGSCAIELLRPADTARVTVGVKGSVEHFAVLVDNLEAAVADLRGRGIVFEGEIGSIPRLFGGFKSIFLKGPSSESIELCEISGSGGAP